MDARPLKDVFTDLVGDPSAAADALAGAGHDLPPELVAEAVVSFAGTAPAEVAEHLAPFVTAHSGVPVESELAEPGDWVELLATAPEVGAELDDDALPEAVAADTDAPSLGELAFGAGADTADPAAADSADLDLDPDPGGDLDDEPVAVGGVAPDLSEPPHTVLDVEFDEDADGDADEGDLDDLDG